MRAEAISIRKSQSDPWQSTATLQSITLSTAGFRAAQILNKEIQLIAIALLCCATPVALTLKSQTLDAQTLEVASGTITFESKTDVQSFKGGGSSVSGKVNLGEKKLRIVIDLRDWKASGRLRTLHMHENYLETEKFPEAIFSGDLLYESATGKVQSVGTLELHGKKKPMTIAGTVKKQNSEFSFESNFIVKLSDFDIPIPKVLVLELNNEVNVNAKAILRESKQ